VTRAPRPALVAFDLDGTLIDSRQDLADAINELLGELGAAPLPIEAVGRMVGDGAAVLVSRALSAAASRTPVETALARFLELYERRLVATTRPYEGIPEVLEALRRTTRLAVLTNKPHESTMRLLRELSLAFPEEMVIGGDGPYARKPAPQGLLALSATAGADPRSTLLVGDSLVDVRTAHAAGSMLCLARYGYGCNEEAVGALTPEDWAIDAPVELLACVGV
jgi:phosphoglycolate phosphatase